MKPHSVLSPEYRRSLARGALVVILLFILASGLDYDPVTTQITLMAALGYLGGVTIIAVRRPQTPTETDVWLMRWGFIPLFFAAQIAVREAWTWMGRLR